MSQSTEAILVSITVDATYRCTACGKYGRETLTGVIEERIEFQCNQCHASIHLELTKQQHE